MLRVAKRTTGFVIFLLLLRVLFGSVSCYPDTGEIEAHTFLVCLSRELAGSSELMAAETDR